jgi:peptidoglycan-associated lipoprotein
MRKLMLVFAIALIASGCASKEAQSDKSDRPTSGTVGSAPASGSSTAPAPRPIAEVPGRLIINGPPLRRSVYFDFDSNAVTDGHLGTVRGHARNMTEKNRDTLVRIEGNTDERGSREYNLALGQRRAEAVKKMMTVLGVAANRIETISFGEEKPRNAGHDEASWAENRRADIKYPGE